MLLVPWADRPGWLAWPGRNPGPARSGAVHCQRPSRVRCGAVRAGGITICMGELVEAWQGKVEAPARPCGWDGCWGGRRMDAGGLGGGGGRWIGGWDGWVAVGGAHCAAPARELAPAEPTSAPPSKATNDVQKDSSSLPFLALVHLCPPTQVACFIQPPTGSSGKRPTVDSPQTAPSPRGLGAVHEHIAEHIDDDAAPERIDCFWRPPVRQRHHHTCHAPADERFPPPPPIDDDAGDSILRPRPPPAGLLLRGW